MRSVSQLNHSYTGSAPVFESYLDLFRRLEGRVVQHRNVGNTNNEHFSFFNPEKKNTHTHQTKSTHNREINEACFKCRSEESGEGQIHGSDAPDKLRAESQSANLPTRQVSAPVMVNYIL